MANMKRYKRAKRKGVLHDYLGIIKVISRDNKLYLLSNRFGYEIALLSEQEFVHVEIVDVQSRDEYCLLKSVSDKPELKTRDILIQQSFRNARVKKHKIKRASEYYQEHKKLDKNITIELRYVDGKIKPVLVDGFSRWVVTKRFNLKEIKCDIINPNMELI